MAIVYKGGSGEFPNDPFPKAIASRIRGEFDIAVRYVSELSPVMFISAAAEAAERLERFVSAHYSNELEVSYI
jgi:hypothetical protein